MLEILGEATGLPPARFEAMLAGFPGKPLTDAAMTEEAYQEQRAALMQELPGVLAWVIEGAVAAHADESFMSTMWFNEVHKN